MVTALQKLQCQLSESPIDCVWIHFSGHGFVDNKGMVFWVPTDATSAYDCISLEFVFDTVFLKDMQRCPCLHIITADQCQDLFQRGTGLANLEELCNSRFGGPQNQHHQFVLFLACEEGRTVADTGRFSRGMCEAMKEMQHQHCSVTDLFMKVTEKVKSYTEHAQTPVQVRFGPDLGFNVVGPPSKAGKSRKVQDVEKILKGLCDEEWQAVRETEDKRRRIDKSLYIVCDGNIGCGKSTFLDVLEEGSLLPEVDVVRVPVARNAPNTWGTDLDEYYRAIRDPSPDSERIRRAALKLEHTAWEHFFKTASERTKHVIADRGALSCVKVFCKTKLESKHITSEDYSECLQLLERLKSWQQPTLTLYFRVTPETALERVQARAAKSEDRGREADIDIEYLRYLHEKFEELYKHRDDVALIDANRSPAQVSDDVLKFLTAKYPGLVLTNFTQTLKSALTQVSRQDPGVVGKDEGG